MSTVQAQKDDRAKGAFDGLLRAGVSGCQIHGDGYGGYNKVGFNLGIGTFTKVGDNLDFQLEINYANRGSRKRPTKTDFSTYAISPHYIDVPLLLKTKISVFEVEFGLNNGFFLFHNESDNLGRIPEAIEQWTFNRYELAANIGINKVIVGDWIANARFHYSILPASGGLGNVNGNWFYGGGYHNAITLSLHRVLHWSSQ